MRYAIIAILIMVAIAMLTSCSAGVDANGGFKIEPSAPAMQAGIQAFGTLASSGTYEMELAPSYTRLARLRYNAANLLEQNRISIQFAIDIQNGADEVRVLLDQARIVGNRHDLTAVTRLNNKAKQMLDKLEKKL